MQSEQPLGGTGADNQLSPPAPFAEQLPDAVEAMSGRRVVVRVEHLSHDERVRHLARALRILLEGADPADDDAAPH